MPRQRIQTGNCIAVPALNGCTLLILTLRVRHFILPSRLELRAGVRLTFHSRVTEKCYDFEPSERPLVRGGNGHFLSAKPLLKKDQAEQDLVVVLPTRRVQFKEFADCRWPQELIDFRAGITQGVGHPVADGISEPVVDNIDGKSAFSPSQNRLWKESATNLTVQPFP